MQVVWSSPTESYWQGLRVAPQARSLGIASLFFHIAARLCVERQGAGSIARWGVVSNNDKMTAWSQRLGLHGPQAFRRYHAEASADAPSVPLPPGFTFRRSVLLGGTGVGVCLELQWAGEANRLSPLPFLVSQNHPKK